MRKHVLKFGGTCLGDTNKYKWILNELKDNYINKNIFPIVVVSAISPKNKEEGTTSNLIKCLSKEDYSPYLDIIKNTHEKLINRLDLENTDIYKKCIPKFKEIEILANSAKLLQYNSKNNNHTNHILYENIVKIGEELSAEIMNEYLNKNGLYSDYLDLSNIIPNNCENMSIYNKEINENIHDIYTRSLFISRDLFVVGGYLGNWSNIFTTNEKNYSN